MLTHLGFWERNAECRVRASHNPEEYQSFTVNNFRVPFNTRFLIIPDPCPSLGLQVSKSLVLWGLGPANMSYTIDSQLQAVWRISYLKSRFKPISVIWGLDKLMYKTFYTHFCYKTPTSILPAGVNRPYGWRKNTDNETERAPETMCQFLHLNVIFWSSAIYYMLGPPHQRIWTKILETNSRGNQRTLNRNLYIVTGSFPYSRTV